MCGEEEDIGGGGGDNYKHYDLKKIKNYKLKLPVVINIY